MCRSRHSRACTPELRARCRQLIDALPSCGLLYAMKANANPTLLSVIREEGMGIDAVSIGEVMRLQACRCDRHSIITSTSSEKDFA